MRLMFAAFNMISTDISTMMKFRLINTPSRPVINSTALTATYALRGIIVTREPHDPLWFLLPLVPSRLTSYVLRSRLTDFGVFASTIAPMTAPSRNTPTISNCNRYSLNILIPTAWVSPS